MGDLRLMHLGGELEQFAVEMHLVLIDRAERTLELQDWMFDIVGTSA